MGWFWADTEVAVTDARVGHQPPNHGAMTGTPPVRGISVCI